MITRFEDIEEILKALYCITETKIKELWNENNEPDNGLWNFGTHFLQKHRFFFSEKAGDLFKETAQFRDVVVRAQAKGFLELSSSRKQGV